MRNHNCAAQPCCARPALRSCGSLTKKNITPRPRLPLRVLRPATTCAAARLRAGPVRPGAVRRRLRATRKLARRRGRTDDDGLASRCAAAALTNVLRPVNPRIRRDGRLPQRRVPDQAPGLASPWVAWWFRVGRAVRLASGDAARRVRLAGMRRVGLPAGRRRHQHDGPCD